MTDWRQAGPRPAAGTTSESIVAIRALSERCERADVTSRKHVVRSVVRETRGVASDAEADALMRGRRPLRCRRRSAARAPPAGRGPCPSMTSISAPGIFACEVAPGRERDQRIGGAVNDLGRHADRAEQRRAVAVGGDRDHLARRARRAIRAPNRDREALAQPGGRRRIGRAADQLVERAHSARRSPIRRRSDSSAAQHQRAAHLQRRSGQLCARRSSVIIRVRLFTRVGAWRRHALGDHPAHRRAADVRRGDAERIEDADACRRPCRRACTGS